MAKIKKPKLNVGDRVEFVSARLGNTTWIPGIVKKLYRSKVGARFVKHVARIEVDLASKNGRKYNALTSRRVTTIVQEYLHVTIPITA